MTPEPGLLQAALATRGGSELRSLDPVTQVDWSALDRQAQTIRTPAQYALFTSQATPSGFATRWEHPFKAAVRLAFAVEAALPRQAGPGFSRRTTRGAFVRVCREAKAMNPHRALMIVDVQRAFRPPPSFVEKVRRYARRFPCRIFTQYLNPPDSMFRRMLNQKCCAPGTPDTDLLLVPEPDDLIFKKSTYGLTPRHLRRLRARKINRVTVCGLDTDACVLGVLFSLFDARIECHLKEDLCWSSSGLHLAAMKIVRAQFPVPR